MPRIPARCRHLSSFVVIRRRTSSVRLRGFSMPDPSIGTKKEHNLGARFRKPGARPGREPARRSSAVTAIQSSSVRPASKARRAADPAASPSHPAPPVIPMEHGGSLRPM